MPRFARARAVFDGSNSLPGQPSAAVIPERCRQMQRRNAERRAELDDSPRPHRPRQNIEKPAGGAGNWKRMVLQKSVVLAVVLRSLARVPGQRAFSAASASAKSRSMSIDNAGCVKVDIGLPRAFMLEHCPVFGEQDGRAPGWPAHRLRVR